MSVLVDHYRRVEVKEPDHLGNLLDTKPGLMFSGDDRDRLKKMLLADPTTHRRLAQNLGTEEKDVWDAFALMVDRTNDVWMLKEAFNAADVAGRTVDFRFAVRKTRLPSARSGPIYPPPALRHHARAATPT